jgi:thiol-disulfide isomerase/thioredoxin
MKRIALIVFSALLAFGMFACGGSIEKKTSETAKAEVAETAKVIVYYFHGKQRCKTCLAIQDIAAKTIAENFADNSDVKFIEIDYSEKANEAIADKYEVANSSLFVVSGEGFVNLTDLAFANALRNPENLKESLVNEVNKFINQ